MDMMLNERELKRVIDWARIVFRGGVGERGMLTCCVPQTELDQLVLDVEIVHVVFEHGGFTVGGG
jgi:hypothetical protein